MNPAPPPNLPFANWLARRGSLRTQLIAWNIAILALLLGGLGLVIRSAVYSAMIASIDRDLEERLRHFHEPPPPPAPPRRNPNFNSAVNLAPNPSPFPLASDPPPFPPQQEELGNGREADPRPQEEMGGNPPPRPQAEQADNEPQRSDNNPRDLAPAGSPLPRREEPPPQNTDPYRPLPLDLQGQQLGRQDIRQLWDAGAFAQAAKGDLVHSTVVVGNVPLRILSWRFPARGRIAGVIQTAYPLNEAYRAMRGLDRALLMLIPFALLCAGLAGAYLTGRVLRRVRSMTQAAEQMGAQAFSQRLPVAGNDEFAGLAETFNGLLGRLEGAFKQQQRLLEQQERLLEQQRRFTADASHELKTPLTIIKGHTSLTLSGAIGSDADNDSPCRQSLQEIDRAADSMSHLVQDLLLLARSDGGQLGRHPIKLLLREVLDRALSGARAQTSVKVALTLQSSEIKASEIKAREIEGRKVETDITEAGAVAERRRGNQAEVREEEELCLLGNETELIRLFANLLENAVRYTPENGSVTVTARREGTQVVVTIADTGVGIAPEHLPHLGERFYRVDTSRTRPTGGTGLGLSICKGIVEAHNGTLAFASIVGSGTTVTVTLPSA